MNFAKCVSRSPAIPFAHRFVCHLSQQVYYLFVVVGDGGSSFLPRSTRMNRCHFHLSFNFFLVVVVVFVICLFNRACLENCMRCCFTIC